jgi:hypothetical protein
MCFVLPTHVDLNSSCVFRVPFLGEIVCPRIVVVAVHGALVMVI